MGGERVRRLIGKTPDAFRFAYETRPQVRHRCVFAPKFAGSVPGTTRSRLPPLLRRSGRPDGSRRFPFIHPLMRCTRSEFNSAKLALQRKFALRRQPRQLAGRITSDEILPSTFAAVPSGANGRATAIRKIRPHSPSIPRPRAPRRFSSRRPKVTPASSESRSRIAPARSRRFSADEFTSSDLHAEPGGL